MSYKYLKDTSIADTAFVASGKTLNELFESAGLAVTNTMVKSLKSVKPKKTAKVKLKAKDHHTIKGLLKYEEPRVIRRANILNCLHLGYGPVEISGILNIDRKTVTNV